MTQTRETQTGATRLIETIEDAERSTLEAVRTFVDAVDGVFPEVGEDGPRRKIIDSAFRMVEQLVGASNQLAQGIVTETQNQLGQADEKAKSAK